MTSLERAGIDMARRNLLSLCENAEKRMVNITENASKDLSLLSSRLVESSRRIISEKRQKVEYLESHLNALSPEYVLSRGFITCEDPETCQIVPFVKDVEEGRTYVLRFSDGSADAIIEKKFPKEGDDGGHR
jgi:exonuclease VII large subunit